MPRGREQFPAVCLVHMRRQHPCVRHRDRTVLEMGKNRRQTARRTRDLDPAQGRVLGQVQYLRAEGEQRWIARSEVEPSRVHLHEAPDQRRGCVPLTARET